MDLAPACAAGAAATPDVLALPAAWCPQAADSGPRLAAPDRVVVSGSLGETLGRARRDTRRDRRAGAAPGVRGGCELRAALRRNAALGVDAPWRSAGRGAFPARPAAGVR